MISLLIVGAGGHGRETLDIAEALGLVVQGFVSDDLPEAEVFARRRVTHLGSLRSVTDANPPDRSVRYVIGIGSSGVRRDIDSQIGNVIQASTALIHPTASNGADNQLGAGVLLAAGARITTNVHLGRHTHLNVNAVVSHDCRLGDYVTLSPGVTLNGNVTVDDGAFFGTGAIVLPGIHIGAKAIVGAGAVVTSNVAPGATVVGSPARPLPNKRS